MAKRKAKKEATVKRFLALETECGSSSQLTRLQNDAGCVFLTVEAARRAINDTIAWNGQDGTTYVIAEIIDVGSPNDVTWGGKGLKD